MANLCPNCKTMYSSKLINCPKQECVTKREAMVRIKADYLQAEKDKRDRNASWRKRIRRPLKRGRFTR